MKRRDFVKQASAGLVALPALNLVSDIPTRCKPVGLDQAKTVRLIAPGGPLDQARLDKAMAAMKSLGLKPSAGMHCLEQDGYLAGSDAQRLEDLHDAYRDPSVDLIWAIRGGYGCTRLLSEIDYKLIKRNPKILIGFSDITALLLAIYERTGVIGFHGPLASWPFTEFNARHLKVLYAESTGLTIHGSEAEVLRSGSTAGKLIGGNLSLLASMAGTRYLPKLNDALIFIEDVGEDPYRIDRMLTQLRQSAGLEEAAGLIFGEFADCDDSDPGYGLRYTLQRQVDELAVPALFNFPFGHDRNMCTLPIGISAQMDTGSKSLTLLESAVI